MCEFVPLRIAKKLKEKGFKEECVAHYYSNDPTCLIKNTALADYVQQPFCIESIKRSWNRCELNPCNSGCYYDVPTISQVLKWLREEKKKFVKIEMHECKYLFAIERTDECSSGVGFQKNDALCFIPYKTYEEATIAGIEYCLDNLI